MLFFKSHLELSWNGNCVVDPDGCIFVDLTALVCHNEYLQSIFREVVCYSLMTVTLQWCDMNSIVTPGYYLMYSNYFVIGLVDCVVLDVKRKSHCQYSHIFFSESLSLLLLYEKVYADYDYKLAPLHCPFCSGSFVKCVPRLYTFSVHFIMGSKKLRILKWLA